MWLTVHFLSQLQRYRVVSLFSYVRFCQSIGVWPFPICLGSDQAAVSVGVENEQSVVLAFDGEALRA
jgi:hypothetical protein